MTTELVWSTVKPTFAEVKGKKIKVISMFADGEVDANVITIYSKTTYEELFEMDFICYADLTAPVSPLPLWGKLTLVSFDNFKKKYYVKYGELHTGAWDICTPYFDTEAEAILAWNRIAKPLNEVEI